MTLFLNIILVFAFNMSDISNFHMTWVITMESILLSALGKWLGVPYVSDAIDKFILKRNNLGQ